MRVLIVGGGIAGFSLARFLHTSGIDCTVVERAERFRPLGHFIALKSDGVRVLDRLGIRRECEERSFRASNSIRYMTARGRLLRHQTIDTLEEALGGYLTLRRADLSDVLHQRVANDVDVRFGVTPTRIEQTDAGAVVTLSDGKVERCDVVVGADGIHSPTRRRIFGDAGERYLGGSYVALELECADERPEQDISAYLGRGRVVATIPVGRRTVAAVVYHGGQDLRTRLDSPARARDFFAREYAHFHASVRSLFSSIDTGSFVFVDTITMIRLPRVVAGRVVLLGDAAACPTFLSGMGSSFAMLSAEALASQLASRKPITEALAEYDRGTLARAAAVQQSALRMQKLVLDESRVYSTVRDSVLAAAPLGWLLGHAKKFYGSQVNAA